jgi:hypothetical protein
MIYGTIQRAGRWTPALRRRFAVAAGLGARLEFIVVLACVSPCGYKPSVAKEASRQGAFFWRKHEWRRVKTMQEALRIAAEARKTPPENTARRGGNRVRLALSKNKSPVGETPTRPDRGKPRPKAQSPQSGKPPLQPSRENPDYLYISGRGHLNRCKQA